MRHTDAIGRASTPGALCDALRAYAPHERTPAERLDALIALSDWLDAPPSAPIPSAAPVPPTSPAARLWTLEDHLHSDVDAAALVGDLVGAVLEHASALELLSRAGLPREGRLLGELVDRLARKLLPRDDSEGDLVAVLALVCAGRGWLQAAPSTVVGPLITTLLERSPRFVVAARRLAHDTEDAIAVLAVRLADLGVATDLRARAGGGPLADWPFLDLPRWCDLILERRGSGGDRVEHLVGLSRCLSACRRLIERARSTLMAGAVSADLVFRLELAERQLHRIEQLVTLIDERTAGRPALALQTLRELLQASEEEATLRGLVRRTTGLLAKRIIESASHGGEHYIASSSTEYRAMWRSAAGGGLVMAAVAPLKFMLGWLQLPLFFAGFVAGLNYSAAFLFLQVFHLTLATKQPAMTAATLASAIGRADRADLDRLVDLIARTARTQLAAVVGNLGTIIPASLLFHLAVLGTRATPFLDVKTAKYALHSHHLLESGSVLFAALTGVYLWFGSIVAGWVDNWIHWQRLPRALATNRRVRRVIGERGAIRIAHLVKSGAGPASGNIAFGMLLGLTPVFGAFFGLPVEIRHITISTASVVLGTATLVGEHAIVARDVAFAVLGLFGVATMNFVVSFSLALAVALRARDVPPRASLGLMRLVLVRFVREPTTFLWPPRGESASSSTMPVVTLSSPSLPPVPSALPPSAVLAPPLPSRSSSFSSSS